MVDGGGVVNLIMRQPSAVNTTRSRQSDTASQHDSSHALMMQTQTHAMFTAAQTHGSIDHSDLVVDDQASFGPYRGGVTIKEETDMSMIEDKRNGRNQHLMRSQFPDPRDRRAGGRNHHNRYLSTDKEFAKTARTSFFSPTAISSPGNFMANDSRLTARNRLHNN